MQHCCIKRLVATSPRPPYPSRKCKITRIAMDMINFNKLSEYEKASLLLEDGDLLTTNCYYHYNVLLYSYKGVFMELVYDNREKAVLMVRPVNDNILQKYLDNIELNLDL